MGVAQAALATLPGEVILVMGEATGATPLCMVQEAREGIPVLVVLGQRQTRRGMLDQEVEVVRVDSHGAQVEASAFTEKVHLALAMIQAVIVGTEVLVGKVQYKTMKMTHRTVCSMVEARVGLGVITTLVALEGTALSASSGPALPANSHPLMSAHRKEK